MRPECSGSAEQRQRSPLASRLRVVAGAGNDLVVPTNGVFEVEGATGFPIADPLVFTTSQGVDHGSYFGRPEVLVKLLEWLPG